MVSSTGIFVALPHLLYIPVVIAAYRDPKWGVFIAAGIGGTYFLWLSWQPQTRSAYLSKHLSGTLVVIGIGWLIAALSSRLHERQDLYQGLFYHSEAGSILVRETAQGRVIEEVNDKAAGLLHRKAADLIGAPLTVFLSRDVEQELFSRLIRQGAVHATETGFMLPDGGSETVLVSAAVFPGKTGHPHVCGNHTARPGRESTEGCER